MSALAFYALAVLILAASVGVVAVQSPIYGALCLVFAMLGVAGVFALLGAHFLAVAQIVVYAGAIVVLFIFVLMLLNVKREEYERRTLLLAVLAALASVPFILLLLPPVMAGFSGPAAALDGGAAEIGLRLFSRHLAAFEAASMVLMAALVGAGMLARRRGSGGEGQS